MNSFLWGVATSAYQAEGGYNGPGEPQTNWARAEVRGLVAPVGRAAEFWDRYAEDFRRCRELGLSAFRLGIEWSRVQPTAIDEPGEPPPINRPALDGYRAMIASCLDHGLEPVVTLHHFVHPAWLGTDPWLDERTPARFRDYVKLAVAYINERLPRPIRWFITINEPNMLVLNSYLGRQFPTEANGGIGTMMLAYNQLLRAHVLAYNALHDLYAERGWSVPAVSFNNYCSDVYWSDKVLLDLMCARERGIDRADLPAYIHRLATLFDAAFANAQLPLHKDVAYFFGSVVKRAFNWLGYQKFSLHLFQSFLDELYASPRIRLLDYIAIDYYDPFAAHAFRLPVFWDHEFKNRSWRSWVLSTITSKWWDWRVLPRGLYFFCRYYAESFGRAVLIAENGLALRRHRDGRRFRKDRTTRSQFLRLHIQEVVRLRQDGIALAGYLHWSLFDNYEWGTYTPRFGLYSIDFDRGTEREATSFDGDQSAETYATLIRECALSPLRTGRAPQS